MEGGKHVLCLNYYYSHRDEGGVDRAEFCTHKAQLKWDGIEGAVRLKLKPSRIGSRYYEVNLGRHQNYAMV